MIKGINFDVDGTLLDSMHIWSELGNTITAQSIVDVGTIIDINLTQTKLGVE